MLCVLFGVNHFISFDGFMLALCDVEIASSNNAHCFSILLATILKGSPIQSVAVTM